MDWNMFSQQFCNPYAPGLVVLAIGLMLFILGVARHQKRVEARLDEITALLKAPTQVAAIKRDKVNS